MGFLVRQSWGAVWCGVCLAAGLFAGCGKAGTSGDSETHFLATCSDKCSGGLSCLCGVCTKACTATTSCGALSSSSSCDDSCADTATKICDVACTADADCSSLGAEFGCSAGHCREGASAPSGGASGLGAGGAGNGAAAGNDAAAGVGGGLVAACKAEPDLTPTLPEPTSLDADLVARAAAVLGSCMPDDGVDRNATHIWLEHRGAARLYFRFGEQLDCFANAGCGCGAVQQCLGWAYSLPPVAPAVCTGGCDGDVFTGCGDGVKVTTDCSRFGLDCDPGANCSPAPATACDGSAPATCTAQGEVEFCDDGFVRRTPCASLGFACTAGQCVGAGATCIAPSSGQDELVDPVGTGCSGDTLQACLGGHSTTVNCAEQGPGFSCQSLGGAFFCGLAAECEPADNYSGSATSPPTCDGTLLTFCNAGRLEHLDCTTLGFTGCQIDHKLGLYGCTPGVVLQ